jgi:hypothetical protein
MDIQIVKLELIEMLLHTRKEAVLNKIRAILEEEERTDVDEDMYKMVEARKEKHISGSSKSFSWNQVKENIAKAKK